MAAGTIVLAWPTCVWLVELVELVDPVDPLEPVLAGAVPVLETLVWPLLVCAAPVAGVAPVALVVPELPVPLTPEDVVLTGVEDGVPPVLLAEVGSPGTVVPVPVLLGVEVGFVGRAVAVGSVGFTTLAGVPGPSSLLSWLGSSVCMIDSGEDLSSDRACRWLVTVDEAVEVSGFDAEALDALPAELAAEDEELWLAFEL